MRINKINKKHVGYLSAILQAHDSGRFDKNMRSVCHSINAYVSPGL